MKVNLSVFVDGLLHMATDSVASCLHLATTNKKFEISDHENKMCNTFLLPTSSVQSVKNKALMTFRVKCGKVEAEKTANLWASQCQSKVSLIVFL